MRNRLIELIGDIPWGKHTFEQCFFKSTVEKIADTLIEKGVSVNTHNGNDCEFCRKFNFETATATINYGYAHIELAGGNTRYTEDEQFNYCPVCGKERKERTGATDVTK